MPSHGVIPTDDIRKNPGVNSATFGTGQVIIDAPDQLQSGTVPMDQRVFGAAALLIKPGDAHISDAQSIKGRISLENALARDGMKMEEMSGQMTPFTATFKKGE